MELPVYIPTEEVKRVCSELGLTDWTLLKSASIPVEDAAKVQAVVGAQAAMIEPAVFKMGLEVELEHGITFPDANVTNNHPVLTGLIVLAHLKEMLDYYERLEVAELEGDILKAVQAGDSEKAAAKVRKLAQARLVLAQKEQGALSGS